MRNLPQQVTLDACADMLAGFAFKSRDFSQDPNDVPLIKGENVSQGRILWDKSKYWNRDQLLEYDKFRLRSGDIVIAMDRPWVPAGLKWAYIRETDPDCLLVQRVTRLRAKDGIDQTFLRYIVGGPYFEKYIIPITTGVNVPHISGKQIGAFKFPLPDLPTQKRIAGILSAYDDLIENNLKRIKILEEMAQSLYREWFVHFRYPGHESVPLVDSPLGPIPEGWEVTPFTEVADVLSGGTPKTKVEEYWNEGIPFFTPKDAPGSFFVSDTEKHLSELGLSKCASKLYEPRTVFITARGTVGKTAMPSRPMAMNQSCYALRGKSGYPQEYLFLLTRQQVEYLKKNTGGATFDTIIVDTFKRMSVCKPPTKIATAFTTQVMPLFDGIDNLLVRNNNLRQTRDLLLPKLLSPPE